MYRNVILVILGLSVLAGILILDGSVNREIPGRKEFTQICLNGIYYWHSKDLYRQVLAPVYTSEGFVVECM